jgi:proteasome beta subunit
VHARNWIKATWREGLTADEATVLAIRALFAAADEDVATGGPDLVRRIFPTVARISGDGYQELDEATIESLAQDALTGPERGGNAS